MTRFVQFANGAAILKGVPPDLQALNGRTVVAASDAEYNVNVTFKIKKGQPGVIRKLEVSDEGYLAEVELKPWPDVWIHSCIVLLATSTLELLDPRPLQPRKITVSAEARLSGLRDLCGFVEDGSSQVVTIFQDDATRTWILKAGKREFLGSSFNDVIDTALKG